MAFFKSKTNNGLFAKNFKIITIFWSFSFFILQPVLANDSQQKVLFVSSYHPGFPTFFQQVNGLKDAFLDKKILLDVEFMDTKRFPAKTNRDTFRKVLSQKLEKLTAYDVIVVGDDNAFSFALKEQSGLFQNLPIVFLGVNNVELANRQNENPNITGVVEAVSMIETLQLMRKLNPNSKNIIALVDGTPSGQNDLKAFYRSKQLFEDVAFLHLSLADLSWKELETKLNDIGHESSVLLLSAYNDKNDISLPFRDSLALIKKNLSIPLYHLWYHGIGDGVLGGKVISHYEQGKTAGNIVVEILTGKPVHEIKVVSESPNRHVFDFKELKLQNISKALLPKGSIILNEPYTRLSSF